MKHSMVVLGGLLATCLACARTDTPQTSSSKNVFGADGRTDLPHPASPFNAVGRLDSGCTAVLVGKNLLLTAAHCIEDKTGKVKPNGFVFRSDFDVALARVTARGTRVWYGTATPEDERDKDWAILQLDQPVGEGRSAKVDGSALNGAAFPYSVTQAGFSMDRGDGRILSEQKGCAIRERGEEGRLLEDCDSAPGISGAPLFRGAGQSAAVVALVVSEYRQNSTTTVRRDEYSADYANVAIAASGFAATVAQLKNTVEKGLPVPALDGVLVRAAPALPGVGDGSRPLSNRLADYQWTPLLTLATAASYGLNSFDVALPTQLGATPLRIAFGPDCGPVGGVQLAAITSPNANVWEAGRMFEGVGAHFSSGSIRFLRVLFEAQGLSQRCSIQLLVSGSLPAAEPQSTVQPAGAGQGLAHCQAAPYNDPRVSVYDWAHPSVDEARYQVLARCTGAYGYVCSVLCSPPG